MKEQRNYLPTFGQDTIDSITNMLEYNLKRKLLGD